MPASRAGLVLPARAISLLSREIPGGDGNGAVAVVLDSLEFKCGDTGASFLLQWRR